MANRKASAHDIVFQARAGSPELNCCSVNGPRALAMLADWAVMRAEDGIAVNYYGPASFSLPLASGRMLRLDQALTTRNRGVFTSLCNWKPRSGSPTACASRTGLRGPKSESMACLFPHLPLGDICFSTGSGGRATPSNCPWTWVCGSGPGERECEGKGSLFRGPLLLAYDPRFDSLDPRNLPPSTRAA